MLLLRFPFSTPPCSYLVRLYIDIWIYNKFYRASNQEKWKRIQTKSNKKNFLKKNYEDFPYVCLSQSRLAYI